MYGYWRISILIYIASSASAQQNGGNLYCPKKWTAGQTVTLEFHIDQVLYPFQCTGTTDKRPVFLRSTTANGPPKIMCRTADITAMNACTTPLSGDCGCIEKNGSYVLQYMFKANTTIHNGWWSASVQCLNGIATQMLSFTETQCSNITVQETSTVPPSTSETPNLQMYTEEACDSDCKIVSSVSTSCTSLLIGGAVVVACTTIIKVLICHHGEQITRIDFYAERFKKRKKDLEQKLKKIMNSSVRFNVSIDDSDHRFAVVQFSKFLNYNKLEDLAIAVNNFVKKDVKPVHVRTVPVLQDATITGMASIEQKTNTKIFPPGPVSTNEAQTAQKETNTKISPEPGPHEIDIAEKENGARPLPVPGNTQTKGNPEEVEKQKGARPLPVPGEKENTQTKENSNEAEKQAVDENKKYCIQIEGTSEKDVEDAEKEVKKHLSNGIFDKAIHDSREIEEEAKQYIEQMTGTTIFHDKKHHSYKIQGSNGNFTEKARDMVLDFMAKNVRVVPVLFWNIASTESSQKQMKKIQRKTGTVIRLDRERLVIIIEGSNGKQSVEAENQVKEFLRSQTYHQTFDVSKQIQEAAREYIEYMTGTIMVPLCDNAKHSIQVEGISKTYTEEAHVLVQEFLKENVRIVLIPPWNQPIPHKRLVSIAQKTGTKIYTPVGERCVIKIEGPDEKQSVEAENQVRALLKGQVVTSRTITLPEDRDDVRDDVREYIEEMTGTTIAPGSTPRTIEIEGTSEEYLTKAANMVEEYLKKNVRVVTVTFGDSSMLRWEQKLRTIENKTNTTIHDPVEMGKQRYVIIIEEVNNQENSSSSKAEKMVKALFAPCCRLACMARQPAAPRAVIV